MKVRLAALVVAVLACVSAGSADDTAVYGVGGALRPMQEHPSIAMEEMLVEARVTPETSTVDCRFVFRNTGAATTVKMGFPESGNANAGPGAGFTSFETWVDEASVPTAIEGYLEEPQAGTWHRWRVKSVHFAAGEVRRVRVRYSARTTQDTMEGRRFEYNVGTGGSWKGPIGEALVRMRVQYDRGSFTLQPGDGMARVGRDTLEWRQHDVEPAPQSSLGLYLQPTYYQVGTGLLYERVYPWELRFRDGRLWAPARRLAHWLGADIGTSILSGAPVRVALTYGCRRVTAQQGHPTADLGQRLIALPGKPFIADRQLYLPVRAITTALGADVEWAKRSIRMRFPAWDQLRSADLGHASALFRVELARRYPGWAPPDARLFTPEARQAAERAGGGPPWLAIGDFDGNGDKDAALWLFKGPASAHAVFHIADGEIADLVWLGRSPAEAELEAEAEPYRKPITAIDALIRTVPPGVIAYWQGGEKSGRLDLKHDGIELVALGKAAVLHYWDDTEKTYKSVVSAD
jgi:hypothetical protein